MQLNLSTDQIQLILAIALICNALLFFLYFLQGIRIGRLQKRLKKLFANSNGDNLEVAMQRLLEQVEECQNKQVDQQFVINRLAQKVASTCGNMAVIRYNAFGDLGSDLSFSLAMVDEDQNGVIITSIYGREESRIYAKPLEKGKSVYHLSEEELAVLKMASTKIS